MVRLDRILLATDFSDDSAEAQAYACALADRFGAELYVLHVIEDVVGMEPRLFSPTSIEAYVDAIERRTDEQLAQLIDPDWLESHRVVTAKRRGKAFVEIVRFAREMNVDIIVVGSHGRSGLPHMLLGSVAERVVRKAPCPVLTVRSPGRPFAMP